MSLIIFAIAAIPATVVYFVGLTSKNRSKTLLSAIAAVILGFVTGSPAYIATDLFFVVVGYFLTSANFISTESKVNFTESRQAPVAEVLNVTNARRNAKSILVALLMAAVLIAVLYSFLTHVIARDNSTQSLRHPEIPIVSSALLHDDETSVATSAETARPYNGPDAPDIPETDYERSLREYPPMFPTRQRADTPIKTTTEDNSPSSTSASK